MTNVSAECRLERIRCPRSHYSEEGRECSCEPELEMFFVCGVVEDLGEDGRAITIHRVEDESGNEEPLSWLSKEDERSLEEALDDAFCSGGAACVG